MPRIGQDFYGITFKIHNGDHLPPHFHAFYENKEVKIDIQNGNVKAIKGKFPAAKLRKVKEYLSENKDFLLVTFYEINPILKK